MPAPCHSFDATGSASDGKNSQREQVEMLTMIYQGAKLAGINQWPLKAQLLIRDVQEPTKGTVCGLSDTAIHRCKCLILCCQTLSLFYIYVASV